MSFLPDLFTKEHTESVVLIDISTGSVAGAYVRYTEGKQPVIIYSRRLPIETRGGEPEGQTMLRALKTLGDTLIREGAPALVRTAGNGSVDSILVSIDAPWQETSVRTEYFEQKIPFTFTKHMVLEALKKTNIVPSGQTLADESIIGTVLNGYETRNPYGKQAHRASVVILMSLIDEQIAKSIYEILRGLYHTKRIMSIAGSSLRYQAMRITFPHEHDFLILDATGPLTSIALVRRDLLIKVAETSTRTNDTTTWLKEITDKFARLAGKFPLPRTIFLLARELEIASIRNTLDTANLGTLWLSDNPPKIISVIGSHLNGAIQQTEATPLDLSLFLMALYFQHHRTADKI